jgi:hypothetical protein
MLTGTSDIENPFKKESNEKPLILTYFGAHIPLKKAGKPLKKGYFSKRPGSMPRSLRRGLHLPVPRGPQGR